MKRDPGVGSGGATRLRATDHHVLMDEQLGLLFDRQSLRVWPVPPDVAGTLMKVLAEATGLPATSAPARAVDEIIRAYHSAPDTDLLSKIPRAHEDEAEVRNTVAADRYLGKLAVNVANDCNLGCTYCYANGGFYGTPERIMLSGDDAEQIVMRFARKFDYIESVQFMGGEPSMNSSAIAACGRAFTRLVGNGSLAGMPRFQLVTNALVLSSAFLDLCERYGIELTVSLDGPARVHDSVRTRKNGRGSYTQVRKNVDRALARKIRIGFEPTFSRAHLDAGFNLIHLCTWFHDEFGIEELHAPPVSGNRYADSSLLLTNEEKMRQYCAVAEWGVDNLLIRRRRLLHDFTARIINDLATRTRNSVICPAGNSQISVSVKGELSPCWMYTDDPDFTLGHIDDDDLISEAGYGTLRRMQQAELHSHPHCRSCMIQPLCFGCKGADYHETGTMEGKSNCDFMRAMVATTLMRIFSHRDVPQDIDGYLNRTTPGERDYRRLRPEIQDDALVQGPVGTRRVFLPLTALGKHFDA
ncbi:radical SAM protein [Nonomuraea bangladeshensis]|uniref:radical SAM protein n=1 Tax=Nonomuraea bangladeshensis TaxID=404385 RepID=UPI003C2ABF3F